MMQQGANWTKRICHSLEALAVHMPSMVVARASLQAQQGVTATALSLERVGVFAQFYLHVSLVKMDFASEQSSPKKH